MFRVVRPHSPAFIFSHLQVAVPLSGDLLRLGTAGVRLDVSLVASKTNMNQKRHWHHGTLNGLLTIHALEDCSSMR